MVPSDTRFVLTAPLCNTPAGATGQLTRLDSYHVALAFDGHPDLVFDVEDTEDQVWAAIAPVASPSMTDPPLLEVILRSLSVLIVTAPVAMMFVYYTGRGAILTFGLGIAWKAMRYGWRGALPLAIASVLVDQYFILTPDNLTMMPSTPFEWYALGSLLFIAFLRDLGMKRVLTP